MCSENVDVTLEKLKKVRKILFEWFSNNFVKANADKCHLILINPCQLAEIMGSLEIVTIKSSRS